MLGYLQNVGFFLPFLFVLALVIFFHELGHFLVARWCGVTVKVFSVGFGPELLGYTDRHGTRWKISAIPLGGYVRFLGDEDENLAGEGGQPLTAAEQQGAFTRKSLLQRAAIVAAGPIANFVLAIAIYATIVAVYGRLEVAPVVNEIVAGSPAEEAGLQRGDVILAVNDDPISYFSDLERVVSVSAGKPLDPTIQRQEDVLGIIATPRTEVINQFGTTARVGRLGVMRAPKPEEIITVTYSIPQAIGFASQQTWFIIEQTLAYIKGLFTGRESLDQLSGPIGIGQMTGEIAAHGFQELMLVAAFLSISIGLFNLFPIPILDGGRLLYYAFEGLRGRPLSDRVRDFGFRAGIVFLLLVMIVAFRNDISRVILSFS